MMDIHTRHTVHICRMKLNINSMELSQWESPDYLNMAIYTRIEIIRMYSWSYIGAPWMAFSPPYNPI